MKNRWTVARRLKKRRRQNQLKCTWENVKEKKTSSQNKARAEVKVRVVQNSGRGSKGDSSPPLRNTGSQGNGGWDLFTASWSCHTHGMLLKVPFPLKGRRGLEQSQLHGGQPSLLVVAPQAAAPPLRRAAHPKDGDCLLRATLFTSLFKVFQWRTLGCIIPKRNNEIPAVFKYWIQWLRAWCRIFLCCMTHFCWICAHQHLKEYQG